MTTSGVTDWRITARDIIRTAVQEARVLGPGEQLSAERLGDCITRLNGLLKSWETRGYVLWRQSTATVPIVGATNPTTLASDVYDVIAVRAVVTSTYERPLACYARDDYKILPNKTQAGNPSIYWVDNQRDSFDLYLWPVPATATTVSMDYLRKIEAVIDPTETLDIPQDWQETLYTLLAVRLCAMFGKDPSAELVARSQALQAAIEAQDRPESYFLGAGGPR